MFGNIRDLENIFHDIDEKGGIECISRPLLRRGTIYTGSAACPRQWLRSYMSKGWCAVESRGHR